MNHVSFKQANKWFGPPPGLTEHQVRSIPAHVRTVDRGSVEGSILVVVAHQPTDEDIARIVAGEPIFLSCMGGLPPHFLTTSFEEAINPA